MKNILSIMFLFALLASSCSEDELVKNQPINSLKFTASFEQNESRTYVEEGNLLRWTKGDQITLFEGNTLNRRFIFDGETGDNAGTFSLGENPYGTGNELNKNYAVYPYRSKTIISDYGGITATLPAEQSYAESSFGLGDNTMVAVTKDTDDTFLMFKNVGGYLKLQLYGDDVTVKSITLTGNNHEKIAGNATITPVYGEAPIVTMADDATTSIMLDCGEKGVKIASSAEEATAFWVVVPPTIFEKGITITVKDAENKVFTQSTDKQLAIQRNVVKPMVALKAVMKVYDPLREALVKLYQSTNGDNWTNNTNWCSDKPITEWYGVVYYELDDKYCLSLSDNNLTGKIDQTFPNNVKISMYCDANQLTSLNVSGCAVLDYLKCDNNQLTSLDVSGNTSLETLYCDANQLTSLNVSGCTALTLLDCTNNQLASLNVSDCIALTSLECYRNQLTSLDVSSNTSLETLLCDDNQLTSLNVSGNTSLKNLGCGVNLYTSLNVSGCTSLENLWCSFGQLISLNVSGCTALRTLECNDNQLISLDVSDCTALTYLICRNNKITSVIPEWFSQLEIFDYDVRFSYWGDGTYIRYEDRGYGWWYPGEPEKGYHGPN